MSLQDRLRGRGLIFEPAPRANPNGSLYLPYRLRDRYTGKTILRGNSRDDLEARAGKWLAWHERASKPKAIKEGDYFLSQGGAWIAVGKFSVRIHERFGKTKGTRGVDITVFRNGQEDRPMLADIELREDIL